MAHIQKLIQAVESFNVPYLQHLLSSPDFSKDMLRDEDNPVIHFCLNGDRDLGENDLVACQVCTNLLIEAGADVNMPSVAEGLSALQLAASHGDPVLINALVQAGADLEYFGDENRTPLAIAAGNGHVDAVYALLQHGANPNATVKVEGTGLKFWSKPRVIELSEAPLIAAMSSNSIEADAHSKVLAQMLIDAGADVNHIGADGRSALESALKTHRSLANELDSDTIDLLLRSGAKPDHDASKPSILEALHDGRIVGALLKAGANPNVGAPTPAIHKATDGYDIDENVINVLANDPRTDLFVRNEDGMTVEEVMLKRLADSRGLSEGEGIDYSSIINIIAEARGSRGIESVGGIDRQTDLNRSLIDAAQAHNVPFMERLLERGADANARAQDGTTPLMALMHPVVHKTEELRREQRLQAIETLLDAGARAGLQDKQGRTALHFAAMGGERELVSALIQSGAKLDVADNHGFQPLQAAVVRGQVDTVEALLEAGANPDGLVENKVVVGQSPLSHSIENGNVRLLETLLKHGARVDRQDSHGMTALHHAAGKSNDADMVKSLLAHGAHATVMDAQGRTPLHCVDSPGVLDAFVEHGVDVNVRSVGGLTPLDTYVLSRVPVGRYEGQGYLDPKMVDAFADHDVRSNYSIGGENLQHAAARCETFVVYGTEYHKVPAALEKAGCDINQRTDQGITPLMVAAACDEQEKYVRSTKSKGMTESLLKAGADPMVRDNKGLQAVDYAKTEQALRKVETRQLEILGSQARAQLQAQAQAPAPQVTRARL